MLLLPPSIEDAEFCLEAERCRRSLAYFVRKFWHVIEPGVPLIWGWYLDAICDHLQAIDEGLFNRLIICIPPGFAKSLLVSVFWPAWTWLRMPHIRSLFGSYDERLTYRDSIKCRDVIKSKLYQDLFKPEWQLRADVNSMGYFSNTVHGSRKTYYIGSRKKTGWRGNYVIVDDPLSAEDRYDPRIKAEAIDSWEKVLSTRPNRSYHYAFVVVMQRLAEDDLAGYLIEKYGDKYVQLILPTEFDPSRRCETPIFRDPRTEPGELLAPDFFPSSSVAEIKFTLGELDYVAQYQHLPHPLGGNRFKQEYIQFWNFTDVQSIIELHYRSGRTDLFNLNHLYRFMSVDFAASEKTTSYRSGGSSGPSDPDSTSIGHWGVTHYGELILLYREKFQREDPYIIERLKAIYSMGNFGRTPPIAVYAEDNGLGKPLAQHAQSEGLPVEFVNVHKDKIVMSSSAVIRMRGGQIFLPSYDTYPWVHELIKELLSFPGGRHDDDVSMISIASLSLFEVRSGTPRSISTIPNNKPRINASRFQSNITDGNVIGNTKQDERYVNGNSLTVPSAGWSALHNGHNGNGARHT